MLKGENPPATKELECRILWMSHWLDDADAKEVSAELGLGAVGEGGGISEGNHEASVGNVEW